MLTHSLPVLNNKKKTITSSINLTLSVLQVMSSIIVCNEGHAMFSSYSSRKSLMKDQKKINTSITAAEKTKWTSNQSEVSSHSEKINCCSCDVALTDWSRGEHVQPFLCRLIMFYVALIIIISADILFLNQIQTSATFCCGFLFESNKTIRVWFYCDHISKKAYTFYFVSCRFHVIRLWASRVHVKFCYPKKNEN